MAQRNSSFNEQLDAFMGSIKHHESRGDPNAVSPQGASGLYQIMPSNWPAWSKQYLGYVAPMTPANQERVTKAKMTDYFKQFGSWDAVAVAWFAGPDDAKRYVSGDDSRLGTRDGVGQNIQGYITNALNTMSSNLGYLPPEALRAQSRKGRKISGDIAEDLTVDRIGEAVTEDAIQRRRVSVEAPDADRFLKGPPTRQAGPSPLADDRSSVLAALGQDRLPFATGLGGGTSSGQGLLSPLGTSSVSSIKTVGDPTPSQFPSAYGPDVLLGLGTPDSLTPSPNRRPPSQAFRSRPMQTPTVNGDIR